MSSSKGSVMSNASSSAVITDTESESGTGEAMHVPAAVRVARPARGAPGASERVRLRAASAACTLLFMRARDLCSALFSISSWAMRTASVYTTDLKLSSRLAYACCRLVEWEERPRMRDIMPGTTRSVPRAVSDSSPSRFDLYLRERELPCAARSGAGAPPPSSSRAGCGVPLCGRGGRGAAPPAAGAAAAAAAAEGLAGAAAWAPVPAVTTGPAGGGAGVLLTGPGTAATAAAAAACTLGCPSGLSPRCAPDDMLCALKLGVASLMTELEGVMAGRRTFKPDTTPSS
mmetsp:Transcript_36555/g.81377  ORF Transcript_36555/g.81377 Transcript_36555/m.81377 type:complete len:288 (+) Transcript_36555:1739-2602(+)